MQFGEELNSHSGRKNEIESDENKIEELEHVAIFGFDGKVYFHLSKQKYIRISIDCRIKRRIFDFRFETKCVEISSKSFSLSNWM